MGDVSWARELAEKLLVDTLPRRWAHSQGVGRKAESIAHLLGDDADTVVCAAWLHDIGYAPDLVHSGSHALDGARYLRDVAEADETICRLVAHHSYAIVEAGRRGLATELAEEFPAVNGLMADALVYCDMTTSPDGDPVDVEKRLKEIASRYAPGSIVADSILEVSPRIVQSVRVITGMPGFQAD
ncbi:phosphohydrolase [Actinoplanes sp. SE50]|uniref:HD domain-containing protein n=1 Tax=unclassified Actinoplanes TaxID=2626549 RepID=UPI00023EC8CA|nr:MULTISPECIES: HD domain-containing protein [unclassified Actinoplanes]AEV81989.1 metal dependent phosphohydrolase [Actinoplanes sp. SE50/110]ATO80389.1 phosphohydrolase [Actinoplanes sp. SE50]SLL97795.1 phosphohydrolase [Actinoplanes sp. SE50/110]